MREIPPPSGLPMPPAGEPFVAPGDGAAAVLRLAGVRRRRAGVASASVVAATMAVVAAASLLTPRADLTRVDTVPPAERTSEAPPTAAARATRPPSGPRAAPPASPGPRPRASRPAAMPAATAPAGAADGRMTRTEQPSRDHSCGMVDPCVGYWGAMRVRQGVPAELSMYTCLAPTALRKVELRFPTAQEADFSLSRDGREAWRWSRGRTFAAGGHNVSLRPGQCLFWATEWDGRSVAPGRYDLVAVVTADGTRLRATSIVEVVGS